MAMYIEGLSKPEEGSVTEFVVQLQGFCWCNKDQRLESRKRYDPSLQDAFRAVLEKPDIKVVEY